MFSSDIAECLLQEYMKGQAIVCFSWGPPPPGRHFHIASLTEEEFDEIYGELDPRDGMVYKIASRRTK
jgi:hypothetical protein